MAEAGMPSGMQVRDAGAAVQVPVAQGSESMRIGNQALLGQSLAWRTVTQRQGAGLLGSPLVDCLSEVTPLSGGWKCGHRRSDRI